MRKRHLLFMVLALGLSSLVPPSLPAAGADPPDAPGYRLTTSVFGAAGSTGALAGYHLAGTLAQPTPIGIGIVSGTRLYAGFWMPLRTAASGIEPFLVQTFRNQLMPPHPNPFRVGTTIHYSLASAGPFALEVFDVGGRRVRTLADGPAAAGSYWITWDGRDDRGLDLPSGVYFCRIAAGSFASVQRTLLLR